MIEQLKIRSQAEIPQSEVVSESSGVVRPPYSGDHRVLLNLREELGSCVETSWQPLTVNELVYDQGGVDIDQRNPAYGCSEEPTYTCDEDLMGK
ncbi:hypothetical protein OX958_00550 [Kribbella sp. CA-293567]|nr:hypothetical protein [Kribbella sp. CA-293567]WBQ05302.1 hypothetical protein OX958_00550 [Kribbella sp. CA-293567]